MGGVGVGAPALWIGSRPPLPTPPHHLRAQARAVGGGEPLRRAHRFNFTEKCCKVPKMHIRLSENFRAVFYAPFYAAHALGFYAGERVDVDLLSSSAPGGGVSALLDGTVDLTWGGPMRVMKANDQQPGSPLVCFCEVVARDPFYLVGSTNRRDFRLADLRSLRFAAVAEVPTPWLCLAHDLRENGIDPDALDRAPARSMADNLEAVRR